MRPGVMRVSTPAPRDITHCRLGHCASKSAAVGSKQKFEEVLERAARLAHIGRTHCAGIQHTCEPVPCALLPQQQTDTQLQKQTL